MIDIGKTTRKEFLSFPQREGRETVYRSIFVLPLRRKHESGHGKFLIIGFTKDREKGEIVSDYADDINLHNPSGLLLRQECFLKNGGIHYWSNHAAFKLGEFTGSSIDIVMIEKES